MSRPTAAALVSANRSANATLATCTVAATAAGFAAIALGMAWGGSDVDRWMLAARYTARTSFAFFLLAYVTSVPAAPFLRNPFGAAFAAAHLVHLGALAAHFAARQEWPPALSIAVGGAGYAVLIAMIATTWSPEPRPSARRRRLDALGPHYLWFVCLATYVSRIASSSDAFWWPFVAALVAALGLRIAGAAAMPLAANPSFEGETHGEDRDGR